MDNDNNNTQMRTNVQRKRFLGRSIAGLTAVVVVGITILAFSPSSQPSPSVNEPPQLLDFVPPYRCPENNAPKSCSQPIQVSVECVDMRTIDPRQLLRPLTETEISNSEKACDLLPNWLNQDPRINIVEEKRQLNLVYDLSPSGKSFTGVQIFVGNENFIVRGEFQKPQRKASYFVEQSLIELERRGYLP
jgi:hypothetical protein